MSERLRESVSALMDGEAGELELRRLLTNADDAAVRASWQRYHRLQVAVKGESTAFLDWDISERVSSAIGDDTKFSRVNAPRFKWLQPLAGFAVAASVTAVVVLSAGNLNPGASSVEPGQAALLSRVFPATAGVTVNAELNSTRVAARSYPVMVPASDLKANEQADEEARKRLEQYLFRHTENAALNNGQGMIPFARVANFDVE